MNYDEALEYIHSINWVFCNPGLDRITELCEMLGNPQDSLKFIHVAGTNGKGSFCAMLDSILREAGYKVGLYTSPYIMKFNERMAIDGQMISDDELAEITGYVKQFGDKMIDKPTEFELITAIAFEYFARHKCEYVVLECGLGGRLDATNIIKTPVLSVITGIALDHTKILGNTVAEIAGEKAGIIKCNVPVLWCGRDAEAERVISERANDMISPLFKVKHSETDVKSFDINGTVFDFGSYRNVKIPLLGSYQPFNASNVLTAVDILRAVGADVSAEAVKKGLEKVVWHARFEKIHGEPLVIADGGHNPEGVDAAVDSVKMYFPNGKVNIVTGVMADKNYRYMAERISKVASKVYCLTPENPRALPAGEYVKVYEALGVSAESFETVSDAVCAAMTDAKERGIPVVAVGSLYMYNDVRNAVLAFED